MKYLIVLTAALTAFLGATAMASAAPSPNNPNIDVLEIDCGTLGTFEVITMENSVVGFTDDGVNVAKRFAFDQTLTITTFDGTEFGPFDDSFEEGSRGRGFEPRLFECTFGGSFTEEFTLDAGTAEFFGIPEEYIGTDVTLDSNFSATVWVFDPGQQQ